MPNSEILFLALQPIAHIVAFEERTRLAAITSGQRELIRIAARQNGSVRP